MFSIRTPKLSSTNSTPVGISFLSGMTSLISIGIRSLYIPFAQLVTVLSVIDPTVVAVPVSIRLPVIVPLSVTLHLMPVIPSGVTVIGP